MVEDLALAHPRLGQPLCAGGSGTATPAAPPVEKGLVSKKRTFGTSIEETDIGAKIQIRDLVHVLENDGRDKKTLAVILARMRTSEKDANARTAEHERKVSTVMGR